MAHDRVDHDVGVAAGRVDRAVAGRDRGQARLVGAHGQLVAPVDALLVDRVGPCGGLHEAHLSAGVPDARVGERACEQARGVRLPQRVRVGEGHDLAARALHGGVLRADLAAARELQHKVGSGLAAHGRRWRRCSRRRRRSPRAARVGSRARARLQRARRSRTPRRARPRSATDEGGGSGAAIDWTRPNTRASTASVAA